MPATTQNEIVPLQALTTAQLRADSEVVRKCLEKTTKRFLDHPSAMHCKMLESLQLSYQAIWTELRERRS